MIFSYLLQYVPPLESLDYLALYLSYDCVVYCVFIQPPEQKVYKGHGYGWTKHWADSCTILENEYTPLVNKY